MDDKLIIPNSSNDPAVEMDSLSGKLLIKGKSTSDNPESFFSPVYSWMETHLPAFPDEIEFRIQLNACRPQSLLEIARILRLLEKNVMQKKKIIIRWVHNKEDEEMKEAGQLVDKMIRKDIEFESM